MKGFREVQQESFRGNIMGIKRNLVRFRKVHRLYKNWRTVLKMRKTPDVPFRVKMRKGAVFNITNLLDRNGIEDSYIGHYTKGRPIRDGDVVIDIGAHIGAFSIYATMAAKGVKAYAYEPGKKGYGTLLKNIKENNLEGRVVAVNKAVSGREGKVTMHKSLTSSQAASMFQTESTTGKTEEVEATTLEAIFRENGIGFCNSMKINCEGAEFDIIPNSGELLRKVGYIALEYHCFRGEDFKVLTRFLEGKGFRTEYTGYNDKMGIIHALNSRA